MLHSSTIAAISTPPGKGGVAVIRISGADALSVAERIFRPRGKTSVCDLPKRVQIYGDILYRGEEIDDGLITYFPAPNSYTGEDIIEISCHGGMLITAKVLESALIEGASLAGPGEFTRRAFIAGKLSLTETEAISMLLEAESDAQIKLSRGRSRSKLKCEIEDVRRGLTELLSSVYARIDYPEEDLGDLTSDEILDSLKIIKERLARLLSTYKTGRAISKGVPTVICGKPNVGKSTLYNLIVGEDAAIVTDIPGTTRDVLERNVSAGKVLLRLFDTAGIRSMGADEVENIGIKRSKEKIDQAELILALFDSSRPLDPEDEDLVLDLKKSSAEKIAIITKCDENANDDLQNGGNYVSEIENKLMENGFDIILKISVVCNPDGVKEALAKTVEDLFVDEKISIGDDAVISNARQSASVVRALSCIETAMNAFEIGLPEDASSSDIELALGAISELDGRSVTEEIVNDIFSRFCVGK